MKTMGMVLVAVALVGCQGQKVGSTTPPGEGGNTVAPPDEGGGASANCRVSFKNPQNLPLIGGTGGDRSASSPGGPQEALVGVVVYAGDVVDAVAPIFATLSESGGTTGERRVDKIGAVTNPRVIELKAPPGNVVVRINVKYGGVVDQIQLVSMPWTKGGLSGGQTESNWAGGNGGDRQDKLESAGTAITGLSVKYGTRLDQIGGTSAQPVCE